MKKIAPIVMVALLAAAFTSCKKDYTCTCKFPGLPDIKGEYKDVKKKDAEKACDAANTQYKAVGGSCSL
jgi:hypothetical protein